MSGLAVRDINNFLWVEKYRPVTLSDCVLPDRIRSFVSNLVQHGDMMNLLFCGDSGMGKTSVALALCRDLSANWLMINASEERNIETLRTKIKDFASTSSLGFLATGASSDDKKGSAVPKIVILDEADNLNENSTQPALRGFIEEFSSNCRFILTCNYPNRIIPAIQSRCTPIHFGAADKDEKTQILKQTYVRLTKILADMNVAYYKDVLPRLIIDCYPDIRKCVSVCQKYAIQNGNTIDEGILQVSNTDDLTNELFALMKNKNFDGIVKWCVEHSDIEPRILFDRIYRGLKGRLQNESIPNAVVLLADYQYKSAFVSNQTINTVACLTEIVSTSIFI